MNYSNLNIHKRIKSVIVVQLFVQNTLNCVLFLVYFATYVGLRSVEMVKTEELERILEQGGRGLLQVMPHY